MFRKELVYMGNILTIKDQRRTIQYLRSTAEAKQKILPSKMFRNGRVLVEL